MGRIDKITQIIGQKFRSFGGGQKSNWNPMVNALSGKPLQFAAGVDIKSVVKVVLRENRKHLPSSARIMAKRREAKRRMGVPERIPK